MNQELLKQQSEIAQTLSLAVNHDSLSCWFMDVISGLQRQQQVSFDIQTSNTVSPQELLKQGKVIAAITSINDQVPGCKTLYLGKLEYVPVCSNLFFEAFFADGLSRKQLLAAPTLAYDHKDDLPSRFLANYNVSQLDVRTHYIPSCHSLYDAISCGVGWSVMPKLFLDKQGDLGNIRVFDKTALFVKLYWKTWEQVSRVINTLEKQVLSIASQCLDQQT